MMIPPIYSGLPSDPTLAARLAPHSGRFLLQGGILMVLGLLAVALPQFSTLAVTILVGWLFMIGGVLRIMMLAGISHMPGWWMGMISAILAVVVGLVLVAAPLSGILTLMLVLVALFIVEGIAAITAAFGLRSHMRSWGWLLLSGIVDLVLAVLIIGGWPGTATWALGLLVGLNLFFLGLSLLMMGLAAREVGGRV